MLDVQDPVFINCLEHPIHADFSGATSPVAPTFCPCEPLISATIRPSTWPGFPEMRATASVSGTTRWPCCRNGIYRIVAGYEDANDADRSTPADRRRPEAGTRAGFPAHARSLGELSSPRDQVRLKRRPARSSSPGKGKPQAHHISGGGSFNVAALNTPIFIGYCLRPEFISRSFPPTLPCADLHGCRSTLIAALFSHAAKPFSHSSRGSLCVTRSQSRMWPCVRIFNIRIQVLTV